MGDTGALCDQFFIIFDADPSAVSGDDKIIILSPLIRELDIEAQILFHRLFKIDLAYIVTSCSDDLGLKRLFFSVLDPIGNFRLRCLSDGPPV